MKRPRIGLSDLKKSKVAYLNQKVFEEVEKPKKKSPLPNQPCKQVMWMWGQLVVWSLEQGIQVVKEYRFHQDRMWRFDFSLPDKMIGIEYDGLVSRKSRHTTLTGFTGDAEKMNAAQALGWKVIRFTVKNYKTVLKELEKQIEL